MCYVMLGVMVSNLRSFLSAAIHTYIKDFFFNSNNFISVANPCSNYGALPEPDPIYFKIKSSGSEYIWTPENTTIKAY